MNSRESLLSLDMSKSDKVPFRNRIIEARLKKVMDGDTLCFVILLGDFPLDLSIRILGIDSPETALRKGVTQLEKEAGISVKNHVKSLFEVGNIYKIVLKDIDKYGGRYLGDVYIDENKCLSQYLLEKKLVREYFGDAKKEWESDFLKSIISNCQNC